jgi:hypothetical protein
MHSFFKAPLALGLLAISSAPAFADPSGFLSLALGGGHRDQLGLTGDSPLFEGRGTIAVDIAPNWLLQADAVVHHRHYFYQSSSGYNQQYIDLQGALHVAYRSSEQFLIGGFFQQESDREAQSYDDVTYVETHYRTTFGAEGQLYLDRVTLYGQAGFVRNTIDLGYPYPEIGTFVAGQLRYFPTDDLMVDLHGMVAKVSGDDGPSSPIHTVRFGVGLEYQVPEMPMSLFASADHLTTSWQDSSDLDYRAVAGLRFNFGTESLFARDRNGASLDPVQQYPFFGH